MNSSEIREKFLKFFESSGHLPSFVPPAWCRVTIQLLLFTNSGMVQFKDVFWGKISAATAAPRQQRSVRAGGKHNDLENVGYTASSPYL